MELLLSNLSRVQIPKPTHRIYKRECCISFDTPRSEGGLFVDMNSFLAFRKDYVVWNYDKTGNPVYLHIKETAKPLTRGVDDKKKSAYEESYSIVILPDFVSLPFPCDKLPETVRIAVDTVLSAVGAEREDQAAAWSAEKKEVSKHAYTLKQINNGLIIPPSGWKCAKCDKKENLWLNLTDGMILCGRSYRDGTGGNNHSVEHSEDTGYPLVVKLGTITPDLEAPGFCSYDEDDVYDPLLPKHLAHFGIDFSSMHKFMDLDIPDLSILGAATLQIVFSTHSFISRYFSQQSLKMAFEMATADPALDLNMQLTKLGHGLLSGEYSMRQEGIAPRMFKSLITAGHAKFFSMRQQDALKFFRHLLDKVERSSSNMRPDLDPSRSFKFGVEEKILCPYGHVRYIKREDCIISLSIPLHKATNKDEWEAFNNKKAAKKDISTDEIVRPRVPLEACLATFTSSEKFIDYYCTALKQKITLIIKKVRLTSFPEYLVLHMQKFVREAGGGSPEKLDVYIDVPDVIDISHMRSKELQPEEVSQTPAQSGLPDGGGRFKLFGIVSHIGTSTQCGKYVAHILKEGRWVIFSDNKVSISADPPKDMGYLYFFQRLDD
ncbi:unnamed protein product [Microthlaspi erraticum]|uniref:ubiquitinyl hydrolase 1 n=1 Tax=Microthlaspi erraticum TaxID=1685480 RepID=A0A6D2IXN8_9BRAS|nr:unnamed protein product [Microthlaspi erraticum]